MAILVVKDLREDKSLDEHAMKAVAGGSGESGLLRSMMLAGNARPGALEESKLIRGLLKTKDLSA